MSRIRLTPPRPAGDDDERHAAALRDQARRDAEPREPDREVELRPEAEPIAAAPSASALEPPAPDPSAADARVAAIAERARLHTEAGIVAGAVAAYRELVELRPRERRWRLRLAWVLEQNGKHDDAVRELDRALEAMPDDVPLLTARAAILVGLLRYERAEADLRRAARLEEYNVEVLTTLGNLAFKRGRWREGLEPLRRATELAPDYAPAFYYLGEVYHRLDQLMPALAAYERAAELDPANWRALKQIGNLLDRLKRPTDAAVAHRRALAAQRLADQGPPPA